MKPRLSAALALVTLILLGWAAVAFANAEACWNPAFNDPATVGVSDVGDLAAERESVVHGDPMDDVRRALRAGLRPTGRVALASASATDETFRPAHRPRAPPVA